MNNSGSFNKRHRAMILASVSAVAFAPWAAHAQGSRAPDPPGAQQAATLEEVVVTAEHREQNIQKTASSISVRTGAELATQGKFSLSQILEDVPGISGGAASSPTTSLGSGNDSPSAGLTIRGISSNSGASGSITSVAPAVAIYVDGVYQGAGGNYDLDRVEVLRGPQGTLYGRSATAGVVAIHTADPKLSDFGAHALVEAGNYSMQHYSGAVNAPIVNDVLALRLSANSYSREGYFTEKAGQIKSTEARAKLLYQPNDSVSALLGFALQDNTTAIGYSVQIPRGFPNGIEVLKSPIGPGVNKTRQYWGEFTWDLGFATLTWEPAYRSWTSDATAYGIVPFPGLSLFTNTIRVPKDNFHTEEVRLASSPDWRLAWQVGAMYYDNDLSNSSRGYLGGTAGNPLVLAFANDTAKKSTEAIGVFGEATYPVSDTWRATIGLRYDYTQVAVQQSYTANVTLGFLPGVYSTKVLEGAEGERTFRNVTYKARVEHDLTPKNMLYGMVSTGFSPGDVTATQAGGQPIALSLDAETLTAFELGSKNRFLDDSLQVNGAVYAYDYSGYQSAGVNLTPELITNSYATLVAPARVYGAELEVTYKFTADDRVGLNLAYVHGYFYDKDKGQVPTGSTDPNTGQPVYTTFGQLFAKDAIPNVVPFSAAFNYDHTFHLPDDSTLLFRGDVRYLSAHDGVPLAVVQVQSGLQPYGRVDDQVIGDVSLTWMSSNRNYSVTGYVRNVGDNVYKSFVGSIFGTLQSSNYQAQIVPTDPRTYGVVLTAHF